MAMAYKCYDSVVSSKWIRWNYKFVSVCVCWAMKSEWGEWARAQPAVDIKKSTMLYHPTSNASQNTAFILNRRITKKDERVEDMDKVNHFGKLAHSVLWRFVAWFCRSPSPYSTLISPHSVGQLQFSSISTFALARCIRAAIQSYLLAAAALFLWCTFCVCAFFGTRCNDDDDDDDDDKNNTIINDNQNTRSLFPPLHKGNGRFTCHTLCTMHIASKLLWVDGRGQMLLREWDRYKDI